MRTKKLLWLALIVSVIVPLMAACGTDTFTHIAAPVATVPAGESLYVLDGYAPTGSNGAQQIVAFSPNGANPAAQVTLPAGPASLDHQTTYVATPRNGQTTITLKNTLTGATVRTFTIPGTYATAAWGFDAAVLSGNGRWLALKQLGSASTTTVALVNTQTGKIFKTISLNGIYDLDAVSPDGTRLYLLQKLNDNSGHYYVRLYQVPQNQLLPSPIVDKTIPNDIMLGTALARQMASDGSMAYTLYIDTVHNIAFVHILPLTGDFIGARCIDLPTGKNVDLLHYYTLALSADGKTLYVANGALGVVSEIDVSYADEVFYDKAVSLEHFNPGTLSMTSEDKTRVLFNGAVLSADQHTLYFPGVYGIWAAKVPADARPSVAGHYATQQAFTSVALSADGKTLYAVDPSRGITLIDSASGQVQQTIEGPLHAPWGIEWVRN